MSKMALFKSTYSSSTLLEWVKHFDIIENLCSNTQHGCSWIYIYIYVLLWTSMSIIGICLFSPWHKTMYIWSFEAHRFIRYAYWTQWSLYNMCVWPYIETPLPLRVKQDTRYMVIKPSLQVLSIYVNTIIEGFKRSLLAIDMDFLNTNACLINARFLLLWVGWWLAEVHANYSVTWRPNTIWSIHD